MMLQITMPLVFLSADIIAPILTKLYNVSIETQSVISDWTLSKVFFSLSPIARSALRWPSRVLSNVVYFVRQR